MNLNEFAKEVHANAVAHGWWKVEIPGGNFEFASGRTARSNSEGLGSSAAEEYTDAVAIALIHAEISEALEEWRDNRPMVYYKCRLDTVCNGDCKHDAASCVYKNPKPEGIAVELIDVVLRILDTAAAWNVNVDIPEISIIGPAVSLPEEVAYLHSRVGEVYEERCKYGTYDSDEVFSEIVADIFSWLRAQNIDPEALMQEKHRYNQTRPYKHGGKRI